MPGIDNEVLSVLSEDLYGLWEVEVQVPVGRAALRHVLEDLLRRGLVEWFGRDGVDGVPRQVAPGAVDLADDAVWAVPPEDARHLLVTASREGVAAYLAGAPAAAPDGGGDA